VRDRLHEFGSVEIAMITFSTDDLVDDYRRRVDLPFPILLDRDRTSYLNYGLDRATNRRVWNLGTLRRYSDILRRDGIRDLRRPTEDTRQLGGDFVIDARGRLAWGFWSEGPDDRPSVDEILTAVDDTRPWGRHDGAERSPAD
jgi:hypothetical protein